MESNSKTDMNFSIKLCRLIYKQWSHCDRKLSSTHIENVNEALFNCTVVFILMLIDDERRETVFEELHDWILIIISNLIKYVLVVSIHLWIEIYRLQCLIEYINWQSILITCTVRKKRIV